MGSGFFISTGQNRLGLQRLAPQSAVYDPHSPQLNTSLTSDEQYSATDKYGRHCDA